MKVRYNQDKYPFIQIVKQVFQTEYLDLLHEDYQFSLRTNQKEDQKTELHAKFYESCGKGSEFNDVYQELVKNYIYHLFNEPIVYQVVPTFRAQIPNNLAVAEWHRDRDYYHNPSEVNFFLPLTRAFGKNTIWIETYENAGDYYPLEANPGEIVIFNGSNLVHGNHQNDTGCTRLSIDFRVMPQRLYKEIDAESISLGKKMSIGSYYECFG